MVYIESDYIALLQGYFYLNTQSEYYFYSNAVKYTMDNIIYY